MRKVVTAHCVFIYNGIRQESFPKACSCRVSYIVSFLTLVSGTRMLLRNFPAGCLDLSKYP
jgi:hypothetical protein